ncbi:hypothetical protein [Spiroplasma sp. AdecLV25b]|uniref:hypothetical protein n=1 Tax=Spiroplasma sp. AdecLV25b TaxID=3027162 RepID=UPI0027DED8FB|nr:hypothetical protein [Spiroplasma sp. AdecLV25b]
MTSIVPYAIIIATLSILYSIFLFKYKIKKRQLLFIVYYFCFFMMVNAFQYICTINDIIIKQVFSIILGVIISFILIVVAIPATLITGNLRKRKLYIWWSHFWMFLSAICFLIMPSVETLIFLNVAIGMSLGSLSVHEYVGRLSKIRNKLLHTVLLSCRQEIIWIFYVIVSK